MLISASLIRNITFVDSTPHKKTAHDDGQSFYVEKMVVF